MAKISMAEVTVDADLETVRFDFEDGTSLTFRLEDMSERMVRLLALHGAEQKYRDSYSGAKAAVEAGKATSEVAFAVQNATRIHENLLADVWASRESGPSRLTIALAEVKGVPVAEIAGRIRELEKTAADKAGDQKARKAAKETLSGIRKNARVQAVLLRLEQEANAKKIVALAAAVERAEDAGDEEIAGF